MVVDYWTRCCSALYTVVVVVASSAASFIPRLVTLVALTAPSLFLSLPLVLPPSFSLSACSHTHTHTRTYTYIHTHTHTPPKLFTSLHRRETLPLKSQIPSSTTPTNLLKTILFAWRMNATLRDFVLQSSSSTLRARRGSSRTFAAAAAAARHFCCYLHPLPCSSSSLSSSQSSASSASCSYLSSYPSSLSAATRPGITTTRTAALISSALPTVPQQFSISCDTTITDHQRICVVRKVKTFEDKRWQVNCHFVRATWTPQNRCQFMWLMSCPISLIVHRSIGPSHKCLLEWRRTKRWWDTKRNNKEKKKKEKINQSASLNTARYLYNIFASAIALFAPVSFDFISLNSCTVLWKSVIFCSASRCVYT